MSSSPDPLAQLQETLVRQKVRELKKFYTNVLVYAAISVFCVLLWCATGGFFWPLWVILGFLVASASQAIRVGYLPVVENFFPFLKENWEEEKTQEILKQEIVHHSTPPKESVTEKTARLPKKTI